MMNNEAEIPLPCPGCGAETTKTVGWFRTRPNSFVCSGCGETVHLDEADVQRLAEAFDGLERSIGMLRDTFRGLNDR